MPQLKNRIDTRALGLEIGVNFMRLMTGYEHLHYGLWEDSVEICVANLLKAQEAYTRKLLSLLPEGNGLRILDIGGGAGETARQLRNRGHIVEIVIPSQYLAERCRANLSPDVPIHIVKYEEFLSKQTFDVCLFSESLQYIDLSKAIEKTIQILCPKGEILIADCFRRHNQLVDEHGNRPVGGGHLIDTFRKYLANAPVRVVAEEDLTEAVAPSIELEQQLYNFLGSSIKLIDAEVHSAHPQIRWAAKKLVNQFIDQKRLQKLDYRLNGQYRNSAAFCEFNRYLMIKLAVD